MRNTRTQQRRPALELRLDIFLDLSGVPQGRVPRGRSITQSAHSATNQVSDSARAHLTGDCFSNFLATTARALLLPFTKAVAESARF